MKGSKVDSKRASEEARDPMMGGLGWLYVISKRAELEGGGFYICEGSADVLRVVATVGQQFEEARSFDATPLDELVQ